MEKPAFRGCEGGLAGEKNQRKKEIMELRIENCELETLIWPFLSDLCALCGAKEKESS